MTIEFAFTIVSLVLISAILHLADRLARAESKIAVLNKDVAQLEADLDQFAPLVPESEQL